MFDPMMCETCGCELESDDAVSIIEGICGLCRQKASSKSAEKNADEPSPALPSPVPVRRSPQSTTNASIKSSQPSVMPRSQGDRPVIPLNSPASLISGTLPSTPHCNHSENTTSPPIAEERLVKEQPIEELSTEEQAIEEQLVETQQPFHDTAENHNAKPQPLDPQELDSQEPDWPTGEIPRQGTIQGAMLIPKGEHVDCISVSSAMPGSIGVRPVARKRVTHRRRRDLLIGVTAGLIATAFIMHWVLSREDGRSPLVLSHESLSPSMVNLSVQPTWATVSLNGQPIDAPNQFGQLTLTLSSEGGELPWIEVAAEGYHTDRRPLSVYAGTQDVIVELRRKPYEVVITTEPTEAQVWIDGRLSGLTPTTLTVPAEQTASLIIKANGYRDFLHELTPPEKGDPVELQLALTPMGPKLFFASDPPGADITVEGTTHGTAPLTIELDSDYLNRDVTVTASLAGHADRNIQIACPRTADLAPTETMVVLNPLVSEVKFQTDPPGGAIIIHGKNLGPAPVTMTFDRNEIGETLVVQATLAGSHHGHQELTVPPAGEPVSITIPMEFNAQRLVFLLKCPSDSLTDGVLLKEELVGQIHGLGPDQRFAVLAGTYGGIQSWPMRLDTKTATREQKVRAYDMVRSARLGGSASMSDIMRAALIYNPTTLWLFVSGDIDKMEFEEYAEWAEDRNVSIHVVRASSSPEDDWLTGWLAARQGTLSILGETLPPSLALDNDAVD